MKRTLKRGLNQCLKLLKGKRMESVLTCGWITSPGRWLVRLRGISGVIRRSNQLSRWGYFSYRLVSIDSPSGKKVVGRCSLRGGLTYYRCHLLLDRGYFEACASAGLSCLWWFTVCRTDNSAVCCELSMGRNPHTRSRCWQNDFIRPVLKHGPRSLTYMRVLGW